MVLHKDSLLQAIQTQVQSYKVFDIKQVKDQEIHFIVPRNSNNF